MVMIWRKVTGDQTALHKEEIRDLYCCQKIVRVRRQWMSAQVARFGEERNA